MQSSQSTSTLRVLVRWGLYPVSWLVALTGFHFIFTADYDLQTIWGVCIGTMAVIYLLIEWLFPYEKRWAMSLKSFIADFKFVIINSIFVAGLSAFLALFTIGLSHNNDGLASDWPMGIQLILCLLIFEVIHYTIHRTMHDSRGYIGKVLWHTHAAHHLPPRLYLVMHAVGHPLNGMVIQGFAITFPIWIMGYSSEAVTMFLIINGMHGLISHFNVDVRMGILNYVFVGPELHRYHHSADVNEAKNYGATLSILDQLFGTFVYKPGILPEELGVKASEGFPAYERTFDVLKLPFDAFKR